jgi:hypothetical protein
MTCSVFEFGLELHAMAAASYLPFFDQRSEVRKKGDSSLSRLMSELSPGRKRRQRNDVDRKNPLKRA